MPPPPRGVLGAAVPHPAGPRLLLAEDDGDLRELLVAALEDAGCIVVSVSNGGEALERLAEGSFDVAILAVRMPGLTGMDVLRIARKRGLAARVILMTSFEDPELRARASGLGAVWVLDKPLDVDDLRRAVYAESAVAVG